MQGVRRMVSYSGGALSSEGGVRLELTPTTTSPLAIDVGESVEMRIQRLISENPVVIFTRSACCMCHVMKHLLSTLGVHPTVIELDDHEIAALSSVAVDGESPSPSSSSSSCSVPSSASGGAPAVFIGGTRVGGLESLVALHLSNRLVPMLLEIGAIHL